jgi:GAF domain-containing protein
VTADQRRALLYGLIVAASFVTIDIALSGARIAGSYMLGAIVAGVLGGLRTAAIVALVAFVLAVISPIWNAGDIGAEAHVAPLFVSAAGALLALGAGRLRDQVADQLAREQMLVAVAELPEPGATLEQTTARVVDLLVPRYAGFAALDGGLASEHVRLASRGTAPTEPSDAIVTPLRARGRDLGALVIGDGRAGADDPEFLRVLAGRIALALDNAGLSQELVTVEQQLQAILENLGEAVTVQDRSGRLVFANSAAAGLLGAGSVEELLASDPRAIADRFTSTTEDGAPLDPALLPGRLVLAGREAEPLVLRVLDKQTGEERWRMTKATPVPGPDGEVMLAVNVIEDITDRKREEVAQRLLSDASAALASSPDYHSTLQRVAELAVPALAGECAFYLPNSGLLEPIAATHNGGVSAGNAVAGEEVLSTGEALLLHDGSAIVAPMTTDERTVGVLTLSSRPGTRFTEADVDLALELGRRCATAIENARLYSQLEEVATTLQRSLLPPDLPKVEGWSFDSLYMPAGSEADVGGDFYDVFPTAAGFMAVMGDVVGRGPAAAALTAMGRYTLRTAGSLVGTPTMALARLNDNLRERGDMALCTAVVVLLRADSHDASIVCAGHPLPLLVRGGGVQPVGRIGPLLGAFEQGHWLPVSLELVPGDVLVLYTDGVIDARAGDLRFGEERLQQTLTGATTATDAVERIRAALLEFAGAEQDDDVAVLALQKL